MMKEIQSTNNSTPNAITGNHSQQISPTWPGNIICDINLFKDLNSQVVVSNWIAMLVNVSEFDTLDKMEYKFNGHSIIYSYWIRKDS